MKYSKEFNKRKIVGVAAALLCSAYLGASAGVADGAGKDKYASLRDFDLPRYTYNKLSRHFGFTLVKTPIRNGMERARNNPVRPIADPDPFAFRV